MGSSMFTTWIGFVGVVLGALLGGTAQVWVQVAKNTHDDDVLRRSHAEEIVTLLSQAPLIYSPMKKIALQDPRNFPAAPSEPQRVYALVVLYFPKFTAAANNFQVAALNHFAELQEIGKKVIKGEVIERTADQDTYAKLCDTRDILIKKLVGEFNPAQP